MNNIKLSFLSITLLTSLSVLAEEIPFAGVMSYSHKVTFAGVDEEVSDTLQMQILGTKDSSRRFMSISKIGYNGHTCDFAGEGDVSIDPSTQKPVLIIESIDQVSKAICTVKIVDEGRSYEVTATGNDCQSSCGANVYISSTFEKR